MINTCKDCVFCGRLAERDQSYCGMVDDPYAAVKACVEAYVQGGCDNRMTRGDVQEMRQKLVALERKRDHDRAVLLKTERHIYEAMELISEMRSEVVTPSTADAVPSVSMKLPPPQAVPLPREGGIGGLSDASEI